MTVSMATALTRTLRVISTKVNLGSVSILHHQILTFLTFLPLSLPLFLSFPLSGDWVENKQHGTGLYTDHTGYTYSGDFVGNEFHGEGEFQWGDGNSYKGERWSCD